MCRFFFFFVPFLSLFSADIVVCSYNRPLQLYALLESIEKRVTGVDNIFVILRTKKEFQEGYKIVEKDFPNAEFCYQPAEKKQAHATFKPMVVDVLYNKERRDLSEFFLFAMDDIIILDSIDLEAGENLLSERIDIHGIFYRLGKNITRYYAAGDGRMRVPPMQKVEKDTFVWKFRHGKVDWNYPNTLDFCLYRKEQMKRACTEPAYHDPNSLEGVWCRYRPYNGSGVCFTHSKLVNIPMNRVNTTVRNRHFGSYSIEDLYDIFMSGKKINIDSLDSSVINCVHQDVPFTFTDRD